MPSNLFDVTKQLTFYGAYHSNRVNVLIHLPCVPMLMWTFQVFGSQVPIPSVIPVVHHKFNDYFIFDLNFPTIIAGLYMLYYFALEPVAAFLYIPQMTLSVLTATAFALDSNHINIAILLHAASWVAQILGHSLAEKRAPALVDNVLGAAVLAPFFVHLEILFGLGYRPEFHRHIRNEIGKEIVRIRKAQGEKKRRKEL